MSRRRMDRSRHDDHPVQRRSRPVRRARHEHNRHAVQGLVAQSALTPAASASALTFFKNAQNPTGAGRSSPMLPTTSRRVIPTRPRW